MSRREQKQLAIVEAIMEAKHRGPEEWYDDEPLDTMMDKGRRLFGVRGKERNSEVDDYREGQVDKHQYKQGKYGKYGAPPRRLKQSDM